MINDTQTTDLLRKLTIQDFLSMGMHQIAYIKPCEMEGDMDGFSVHAADGSELSKMNSYPSAVAMVRQNDMHVMTLH